MLAHFLVFGSCRSWTSCTGPRPSTGTPSTTAACAAPSTRRASSPARLTTRAHGKGWCLYKLGCKGPTTYNACASMKWDAGLSFPIQSGHPCLGCSQPDFWDGGGFYQGQSAPIDRPGIGVAAAAAGIGLVAGAGMAFANQAQKKAGGEA